MIEARTVIAIESEGLFKPLSVINVAALTECSILVLLASCENCHTKLWLKVPIDIKLPVPKPVHGHPVTQSLQLFPYFRVFFFDPFFDLRLPLITSGGVEPATKAMRY
jgi:hypothetical protein